MRDIIIKTHAIALFLCLSPCAVLAMDAEIDPTFNSAIFSTGFSSVEAILPLDNGQFMVGGQFNSLGGLPQEHIARLNSDGNVDPTFNIFDPGRSSSIRAIGQQSDGKIIIAGSFSQPTSSNFDSFFNDLARINVDGTLDLTFFAASSTNILSLAIQADDKILIGGAFSSFDGEVRNNLARLNADGSLDTSFINPQVDGYVQAIKIDDNGQAVIGGYFANVAGVARAGVARLTSTGALDTSFADPVPGPYSKVDELIIQSDGQIVVGGTFSSSQSNPFFHTSRVMRISAAGETDISLQLQIDINAVEQIYQQSDGKLVIGGWFFNGTAGITRLNLDGTSDISFNSSLASDDSVTVIQPLAGGNFLTAVKSKSGTGTTVIVKLNSTGQILSDLEQREIFNVSTLWTVALQSDNKILVSGDFEEVDGEPRRGIARLLPDGSLDQSFVPDGPGIGRTAIAQQSDGKILMGGEFRFSEDLTLFYLARLQVDGSRDLNFVPNINNNVDHIHVLENGDILIAGDFTMVNGESRNKLAKLFADGSTDTTFNPLVIGSITDIDVVASKIYLAGDFSSVGGEARFKLARLNLDGTLDTVFSDPNPSFPVRGIAAQTNGKLVISGLRTHVGVFETGVARLNNNGTIDASFQPESLNDVATGVLIQEDGKVILFGLFQQVGDVPRRIVARFNQDGSLDTSFGDFSPNRVINDGLIQKDGKVIFVGAFQVFGGQSKIGIVRLNSVNQDELCVPIKTKSGSIALICL